MGISSARATTLNSQKTPTFISAVGGLTNDISANGFTYRVHTFTGSSNFQIVSGSGTIEYLLVAGGGGGGGNFGGNGGQGGGGAGGLLQGSSTLSVGTYSNLPLTLTGFLKLYVCVIEFNLGL
jgi:hypothetical protein